jgi:uncharacterized protein YggE
VAPAQAQTPASPPSITVNGSAELKVAPDEVILTVGVETDSTNIATARGENDSRVKAITEAARGHGVSAQHVKTEFLDVQPRYRDEYNRRDFIGYFARRSLSITIRNVQTFETLLSSVLAAGANYVHGIEFRTTELRKHRDAARVMALTAAREKAQAMSAALNATIGSPLSIQEGYSGWWSPYSSWWGPRGGGMTQNSMQLGENRGASDDALVPGLISVAANVTVTFSLR